MLMIKLAAFCFVAGTLSLTLKKDQPAFSFLVSVGGAFFLLAAAADQLMPVLEWLRTLETYFPGQNTKILLRVLGIALAAQLAADTCRESGMAAAASASELCGRLLALLEALPLLQQLVSCFLSFLQR